MSEFAVLVNARGNGMGKLQAAERWALVHQWCDNRGIYVGRGRGGAVFFAPLPDGLMPFWVELRRMLLARLPFDPVDLGADHSGGWTAPGLIDRTLPQVDIVSAMRLLRG